MRSGSHSRTVTIAEIQGRLKRLIVIDPEHATRQRCSLRNQTAVFGRKVARPRVAKRPEALKALEVCGADAARDTVKLRVVPSDWKRDGSVQQRTKVEGIMRELPEVVG